MKVATEAQHTNDGHDDGKDEVMITDRAMWCTRLHLWSSWLLLDNHYIGTRLLEEIGEGDNNREKYHLFIKERAYNRAA